MSDEFWASLKLTTPIFLDQPNQKISSFTNLNLMKISFFIKNLYGEAKTIMEYHLGTFTENFMNQIVWAIWPVIKNYILKAYRSQIEPNLRTRKASCSQDGLNMEKAVGGSSYPNSKFQKIIATLTVIVSLKQRTFAEDFMRISGGHRYLYNAVNCLEELQESQNLMTICFELVSPCMIDEARKIGLEFGQEEVIKGWKYERDWKQCNRQLVKKTHDF